MARIRHWTLINVLSYAQKMGISLKGAGWRALQMAPSRSAVLSCVLEARLIQIVVKMHAVQQNPNPQLPRPLHRSFQ